MFVLIWARVHRVALDECCIGMMYVEWYGVCNCVVFTVVERCADYGGVNVFLVCFDLCAVYGARICVDVCGVVCVVGWVVVCVVICVIECVCFLFLVSCV